MDRGDEQPPLSPDSSREQTAAAAAAAAGAPDSSDESGTAQADHQQQGSSGPGQSAAAPMASGFGSIVEAFMNSFRSAVAGEQQQQAHRPQSATSSVTPAPSRPPGPTGEGGPSVPSAPAPPTERSDEPAPSTGGDDSRSAPTLLFQMPFLNQNGRPATLAFVPGPLPVPQQQQQQQQPPRQQEPLPANSPQRGNSQFNGFHVPTAPIFVPLGSSPLPFSFLFDNQTNTAWPIVALPDGGQPMPPGAMPPSATGPRTMPEFMAGPPFHVVIDFNFVPAREPERPDPERAARFVSSLERADAELRSRMARLGMGDIGSQDTADHLGCPICLDEYDQDDVPEWIGGQASKDQEVVAVPCAGHHTLHHRCLLEWLANNAPSQWTCPLCRAPLDREKVDSSAADSQQASATDSRRPQGQRRADEELKKAEYESKSRSLREEVRLRERTRGWRCDSPACLPRYPGEETALVGGGGGGGGGSSSSSCCSSGPVDLELVSLLPCRHKLHLDCLCTSMRLEQAIGTEAADDDDDDDDDEDDEDVNDNDKDNDQEGEEQKKEEEEAQEGKEESGSEAWKDRPAALDGGEAAAAIGLVSDDNKARETVGKWVTCPTCRIEAWAELPAKRKSKRVEAARAKQQAATKVVETTVVLDGNKLEAVTEEGSGFDRKNGSGVYLNHPGPIAGTKRPGADLGMDALATRERARFDDAAAALVVDAEDGANDSDVDVEAMLR